MTGEGGQRQPGSLAAPKITILVEYNRTSYPELEVPEVKLALPLYVEEDGHWRVTNYPEEGPSEKQRHDLIGLALDLLTSPGFGFAEIIRAYHDVWEHHHVAASTGDP